MSLLDHARHIAKDFTPEIGTHEINEEIQRLVARLDAGWEMCDREADPARKARLEAHWISLLRQYERVMDARNEPDRRAA